MSETDERFVVGYGTYTRYLSFGLVALGVALLVTGDVRALVYVVLGVVLYVVSRRNVTVLTPEGLTGGLVRRRTVPWTDVRGVVASPYLPRVAATLADGGSLALPNVEWRAERAPGQASPRSAQAVVEWARQHGHDVALVTGAG